VTTLLRSVASHSSSSTYLTTLPTPHLVVTRAFDYLWHQKQPLYTTIAMHKQGDNGISFGFAWTIPGSFLSVLELLFMVHESNAYIIDSIFRVFYASGGMGRRRFGSWDN
jgi:hypothetical protein